MKKNYLVKNGKIAELCDHLDIDPIETTIHCGVRSDKSLVDDIRDEVDAIIFGDLITNLIKSITDDENTKLHLSLAGGRKTMSYHAGAAISFFARYRDRLSHALVSPKELEHCPNFWWPGQNEELVAHRHLINGKQKLFSTSLEDASVDLIYTPFVRLGGRLKGQTFEEGKTYQQFVDQANPTDELPELTVNILEKTVTIGEFELDLEPWLLAIYVMILERHLDGILPLKVSDLLYCEHKPYVRLLEIYADLPGVASKSENKSEQYKQWQKANGTSEEVKIKDDIHASLEQAISKIRKKITDNVNDLDILEKCTIGKKVLKVEMPISKVKIDYRGL